MMFTDLQAITIEHFGAGKQMEARRSATALFARAYAQGKRGQWWAKIRGKVNQLKMLSHRPITVCRPKGIALIPINEIVGTEGRSGDFDQHFRPLKKHISQRWIGIAAARQTDVILPIVELVQALDGYYVRDGHHRISVAKALGQLEIEAQIVN